MHDVEPKPTTATNPNKFKSLPIVLFSGYDTMSMLFLKFDELVEPEFPLAIISISTFGSDRTSRTIIFNRTLPYAPPNSSWLWGLRKYWHRVENVEKRENTRKKYCRGPKFLKKKT